MWKWKFSHPELRKEGEEEEQEEEQKILGIIWNTKDDTLGVAIEEEKYSGRARTPREIVQQQASLYDSLGIIAPFILLGRQWIQKSMKGKWAWDSF